MSYDPHNQYRCTIIRGKAKNAVDDLLPAYANIINEITPSSVDGFKEKFNEMLITYMPGSTKKTLEQI
jgi:hypothetical protein